MSKLSSILAPMFQKWSAVTSVLVQGGDGVVWPSKRYDVYAKEAYLTNVIAYRCIDETAKAMESVKWYLERRSNDGSFEEVTNHPVIDVIYRPNPEEHFGELLYKHTAFSMIAGNVYTERIRVGGAANRIKELWIHRPDRMKLLVNPTTGLKTGYKYTGPDGRSVTWDVDPLTGRSDIWHSRLFSPLDDWYGDGPVEPTAREIDTSTSATEWNKSLLQNSGRLGMIFSFDGNLGDSEYTRLDKKLKEKHTGPKNVGKHIILEGPGAKVTPYGFSPQEMDFIEGNRELARRICLGFGMPPMVIGIPGDNTYSNYQEALLAFWEHTVFFYLRRFSEGFSKWVFEPTEKIMLVPDLDSIPALEPRREQAWKKIETADFLTINEKRGMVGYERYKHVLDETENEEDPADKIYQNATMVPLSDELPDLTGGAIGEEEEFPKKPTKKPPAKTPPPKT